MNNTQFTQEISDIKKFLTDEIQHCKDMERACNESENYDLVSAWYNRRMGYQTTLHFINLGKI